MILVLTATPRTTSISERVIFHLLLIDAVYFEPNSIQVVRVKHERRMIHEENAYAHQEVLRHTRVILIWLRKIREISPCDITLRLRQLPEICNLQAFGPRHFLLIDMRILELLFMIKNLSDLSINCLGLLCLSNHDFTLFSC